MVMEWKDHITTTALNSLQAAKFNKVDLLPCTEDLLKLDTHVRAEIDECLGLYADKDERRLLGRDWFRRLAKATLCYTTMFNKRRGSEVAKMHMSSFIARPKWHDTVNREIEASLSTAEKRMMKQ